MQKADPKTIFSFLWRRRTDQEKIPLSAKKPEADNGSIAKDESRPKKPSENETRKDCKKEENEDEREVHLGSWSWMRKICFVLSLNGGVLYILAFAWLLPCRKPSCEPSWNASVSWTSIFNQTDIITNLAVARNGHSELLLFGFANDVGSQKGIFAVDTNDGKIVWKILLDFSPMSFHCNVADVNKDGLQDCLVTGKEVIVALNSSDGYMFWSQKNFIGRPLAISSSLQVMECERNGVHNILVAQSTLNGNELADNETQVQRISLVTLEETTGNVIAYHTMPCDALPARLISWKNGNLTELACVCLHKNNTEVWTISMNKLCYKECNKSSCKNRKWYKLYSFERTTAISDVLLQSGKEDGLLIAWFRAVVMVTGGSTYVEKWRAVLNGSRTIAMSQGHFTTESKNLQLVIATEEDSLLKFSVLDSNSGAILNTTTAANITARGMTSLNILPGVNNGADALLIEKENSLIISAEKQIFGAIWQRQQQKISPVASISSRTYLILNFQKGSKINSLLTVASVYGSKVDIHGDGNVDLLLASGTASHTAQFTILKKFVLNHTKPSTCWWS